MIKIKERLKNYRFNSLLFKNLYWLLMLVVVPIVGAAIIGYYGYKNLQTREIKNYNERVVSEIKGDMNRIFKEAKIELACLGINSDVELYLYDDLFLQYNYKIKTIKEAIRMPAIAKDYVDSIYIYSVNSGYVISAVGVHIYESYENKGILSEYLEQEEDSKRNLLITQKGTPSVGKKYVSVYCDVEYGSRAKGVAVMNMDIKKLLEELNIPEGIEVCIANRGNVLIATDQNMVGKQVEEIEWYGKEREVRIGKEYCTAYEYDEETELELIIKTDMNSYHDQLGSVRYFTTISLIIMVWITLVLSIFISIKLFQPIKKIADSIHEYNIYFTEKEDLFTGRDEMEYILKTIQRSMHDRINIESELSERINLLKKAQAVALQSQINPHFLNNTLETINWSALSLLGRNNEISEMTGALSRMLSMSLENADAVVPISKEILHCEYYLKIQNKRYEDKFQVVWDIDEEVNDYKIIRIVLQPLIENAIYHGIKKRSGKGIIQISGRLNETFVELVVKDDGLGMSEEKLRNLKYEILKNEIKESRHIGLHNVNQRLRLYFGEEYGLQIESEENVGTKVMIRIPQYK